MKNKDESVIPHGDYCYGLNGKNWTDEKGMPHMGVNVCPYWGEKEIGNGSICWCSFRECGGYWNDDRSDGVTDEDLVEHFGSEKKAREKTSESILFDQCKSCGVNEPKVDSQEPNCGGDWFGDA